MTIYKSSVAMLAALTALVLCGVPDAIAQQSASQQPPAQSQPSSASQDANQQQATWPTQETAPSAPAPNANAPQQTPAPSSTAPAPATKPRVVLGPDGNPQPPAAQQNRGTTVDPSAGPLAPAPAQPAPSQTPAQDTTQPATPQPQTEMQQKPTPAPEPLGTAAAESVRTAGNSASKPAGEAVAPARQHRMRSMLIKLGAIAAVGVAVGSVAAMSRGTPSTPPNSSTTATTK